MIDRDDTEWGIVLDGHGHGGLVERRVDAVDRDWVVRVLQMNKSRANQAGEWGFYCCVAAHVADDREAPRRRLEDLRVDEWRDGLREVNAVDEDVALNDLWKGATLRYCDC